MSGLWWAVIVGSVAVFALKLAGYLIPQRFVEGPALSRVAGLVTVSLLASLVISQTMFSEGGLGIDARIPAVVVAGALLWLRVPFIGVIVAAAVVAAGLRALGWMP